jgi:predicted solute-binding protein
MSPRRWLARSGRGSSTARSFRWWNIWSTPTIRFFRASASPAPARSGASISPTEAHSARSKKFFWTRTRKHRHSRQTEPGTDEARLLIGDAALLQRGRLLDSGWNLLDLGESWFDTTDLPFVYAFWLVREGLDAMPYLELLSHAREEGLRNLDRIIQSETRFPEKMVRSYFKDAVRYDFGAAETKGILEFQRLLKKRGLIAKEAKLRLAA